jgi:hypothetical protein
VSGRVSVKREYGPLCYYCAGRMRLVGDDGYNLGDETKENIEARLEKKLTSNDEVWVCPDCEAFLYRGYPQSVIDRNIDAELKARERGMIAKRGGNGNSRRRKKKPVYKGRRYPDINYWN